MILQGKLVCIRAIERRDLDYLRKLINSPAIESQTIDTHMPVSEKAQEEWFERFDGQSELRCIIDSIETDMPIGYVSVTEIDHRNQTAVVGIKMDTFSNSRIKGDMDEIFRLVEDFCFHELNLYRLEAEVLADNLLSIKNLTLHGYVREGILRKKCYKHGKREDIVIYALLRDEYEEIRNTAGGTV